MFYSWLLFVSLLAEQLKKSAPDETFTAIWFKSKHLCALRLIYKLRRLRWEHFTSFLIKICRCWNTYPIIGTAYMTRGSPVITINLGGCSSVTEVCLAPVSSFSLECVLLLKSHKKIRKKQFLHQRCGNMAITWWNNNAVLQRKINR